MNIKTESYKNAWKYLVLFLKFTNAAQSKNEPIVIIQKTSTLVMYVCPNQTTDGAEMMAVT